MNLLAKEGFLVISVPYNVTFDHAQAAREVYERFNACMDMILTSGLPNANLNAGDLVQLPVFSVGHRLAHLLLYLVCEVYHPPAYMLLLSFLSFTII